MSCRALIPSLLFTSAFFFSGVIVAQTSSIQGNVMGADGRPPNNAEIRFEQRGGPSSPILSHTDINGHYTAVLSKGVYKMSLTAGGTVKASITVQATGADSRIDFDLRPSAEKTIRHYVWVRAGLGTHLPGRWVEAGIRAAPSPTP
jgi:hypothetical protein